MSIYDLIGNILRLSNNEEEASKIIGAFLPFVNESEFENIVTFIKNFKAEKVVLEA